MITAPRALAALAGLALAAAPVAAGFAHDGTSHDWQDKRRQFDAGISVPVASTPNVKLVTNVPDVSAISGCFTKSAPYFVVSSLDAIMVLDVTDPLAPQVAGVLDDVHFENEAMSCGERTVGGVTTRFVLIGVDTGQASSGDIDHVGTSQEIVVVDVTDPAAPRIRSVTPTTSSTHTVTCVRDTQCDYVYTAGSDGHFSIVDLRDLDAPKQVATAPSPALGWAGHRWDFDAAGVGTHTGAGGAAMFDVSDPVHPQLLTSTGDAGTAAGWNDFILHNSQRPNASAFIPGASPSIANGNVLLITEEDYENTDCATAGSFETWHVTGLDGAGAIQPLDRINPVDVGEGVALPHMAFCSAHWFDYHQSGIVAQGYYQGGLRLIDVRDPSNLVEYGYVASGLSEVWDAYWVPQRNSRGIATGKKTNIVYTADLVRGVDVYTVALPAASTTTVPAGGLLPMAYEQPEDEGGSGSTLPFLIGGLIVVAGVAGRVVRASRRSS